MLMHYSSAASFLFSSIDRKNLTATIAAAAHVCTMAAVSPIVAIAMPNTSQQRHAPVLSPHSRHYGGCSRVCCRTSWQKIRNLAAAPVLAAAQFGDKFANCTTA